MLVKNSFKAMSDTKTESPHNTYILFWDCYGLEACHDLTQKIVDVEETDKHNLFDRLKFPEVEPPNQALRDIGHIIKVSGLRARLNPQRSYELYMLHTEPDMTKDAITTGFDLNPNDMAELVRKRGIKLFSYRNNEPERVIK